MRTVGAIGILMLFYLIACCMRCDDISAGNRKMVESNIKELDTLNREAVKSLSGLPRNAQVDLKADVTYSRGKPQFRILEKTIRETREESFDFVPVTSAGINVNKTAKDINATDGEE